MREDAALAHSAGQATEQVLSTRSCFELHTGAGGCGTVEAPMRAHAIRALVALVCGAGGCAGTLRERVTPFPPSAPRAVPWTLNRELLMPVNRRIVIAVDTARGHAPEAFALDRLAAIAARYGERPASWVALGSPGAPPLRRDRHTVVADGPLDADTSYVFVGYVGHAIDGWGLSYVAPVAGRYVYVILIDQERHRRVRWVLPERHLEAQTLVHEYGHMLGLPPCDHGYYPNFPDLSEGSHCVNPDCALARPRFRSLLYGLWHTLFLRHYLEDYCSACRAAIAAAKQYWRTLSIPPSPSA
jgi:hypothetical protein